MTSNKHRTIKKTLSKNTKQKHSVRKKRENIFMMNIFNNNTQINSILSGRFISCKLHSFEVFIIRLNRCQRGRVRKWSVSN